jgi:hypothetical protein
LADPQPLPSDVPHPSLGAPQSALWPPHWDVDDFTSEAAGSADFLSGTPTSFFTLKPQPESPVALSPHPLVSALAWLSQEDDVPQPLEVVAGFELEPEM